MDLLKEFFDNGITVKLAYSCVAIVGIFVGKTLFPKWLDYRLKMKEAEISRLQIPCAKFSQLATILLLSSMILPDTQHT